MVASAVPVAAVAGAQSDGGQPGEFGYTAGSKGTGGSPNADNGAGGHAGAHTGSGGGGGGNKIGGNGGSGIVIIRYIVDSDGDGVSDADEDRAGSNKNDANSTPGLLEDASNFDESDDAKIGW